ncbi:putative Type III effector Hrp-dependent outer [uncultured delta proteobacterium]|uniref:Putative Type III effector Hrp-dependent outer n=1 Tax=uncultured delta proteobacterium TaxID=34034 RepID=A0A212J521_9DELT|nr:putative Type III effector Hrp-dependent outer [uncultured delta proteobacterium]
MKIVVVADDLTGANSNGALLTAKGFPSATCLDLEKWDPREFEGYTAVAFTADSRLLNPGEAREKVRKAVSLFAAQKPVVVSKRIDTTLRGNVGAEIEGALAALDAAAGPGGEKAVAVVVPPFPGSGRIAAGGYLIVHGIPLERSPIARDAATPVKSSSTITVIAEQTDLPSGFISLTTVLAGPEAVRAEALRLWREGCRIIVCDGVTNDDIVAVAQGFREMPFPVLAVDPGPFTAELAAVRLASPEVEFVDRVLTIIGSTSELTQRQIETLRLAHKTHIVRVDCEKLLDADRREREIEAAVTALSNPQGANVFGVCTVERPEDVFSMEELSARLGLTPSEISVQINTALAAIAERLLGKPELRIGGLYTSGGEVTVTTIRTLGGTGFSVRDNVIPLAVYGHVLGGSHPGLPMVTKGGFVGDSEGLVQCVEFLFTKIGTQTRQSLG